MCLSNIYREEKRREGGGWREGGGIYEKET